MRPVPSTGKRIAPLIATMLGSPCAKRRSRLGLTTNQPATTLDVRCLCQSGNPNMLPLNVYWRGPSHGSARDVADSRGGSTCSVAVLPPGVAKGSVSTILTQGKRKVAIRTARLCTKRSCSPKQAAGRGGGIRFRFLAAVALSRCRPGTPRGVPGRVARVFSGRGRSGPSCGSDGLCWPIRGSRDRGGDSEAALSPHTSNNTLQHRARYCFNLVDTDMRTHRSRTGSLSRHARHRLLGTACPSRPEASGQNQRNRNSAPRAAGCGIPKNLVASCALPTFAGSAASYILGPRGLEL